MSPDARRGGEAGESAAPAKTRPWYRRPLVLGVLAVLIALAIIGGVLWWLHARQYESTDDAFIDTQMVAIAPQVAGRVLEVPVAENEAVKPGELLVEIDPADLQAKLDGAEAAKAAAEGGLAQAKAQQQAAVANVAEARAEVAVAAANAENAASELRRDRTLATRHVISEQQLDNATASAKSTAANLEAAHRKEAAAEAQQGVAASQIATAKANVKSAAAAVETARLDLSHTRILAPEAGHVAHKNVAPGNYVTPGQTLMALVPDTLWVTANFKETQLALIHPGEPVDIAVDAYPGKTFKGHVDSIQRGSGTAFSLLPPENATGNYVKVVQRVPVKIVFDGPLDPRYPLGPGMSVVPMVKVR